MPQACDSAIRSSRSSTSDISTSELLAQRLAERARFASAEHIAIGTHENRRRAASIEPFVQPSALIAHVFIEHGAAHRVWPPIVAERRTIAGDQPEAGPEQ